MAACARGLPGAEEDGPASVRIAVTAEQLADRWQDSAVGNLGHGQHLGGLVANLAILMSQQERHCLGLEVVGQLAPARQLDDPLAAILLLGERLQRLSPQPEGKSRAVINSVNFVLAS